MLDSYTKLQLEHIGGSYTEISLERLIFHI